MNNSRGQRGLFTDNRVKTKLVRLAGKTPSEVVKAREQSMMRDADCLHPCCAGGGGACVRGRCLSAMFATPADLRSQPRIHQVASSLPEVVYIYIWTELSSKRMCGFGSRVALSAPKRAQFALQSPGARASITTQGTRRSHHFDSDAPDLIRKSKSAVVYIQILAEPLDRRRRRQAPPCEAS